jgi:hypothetical protein
MPCKILHICPECTNSLTYYQIESALKEYTIRVTFIPTFIFKKPLRVPDESQQWSSTVDVLLQR